MKICGFTPEHAAVFHFVGIGGIGMSALATFMHQAGFRVQGSNLTANDNTARLGQMGVEVFEGHDAAYISPAVNVVVYSTAIPADNAELVATQKKGLKTLRRGELLADIAQNYKTVVVAGSHGKTSTTALTWHALRAGGVDAGVINGGVLLDVGTNAYVGESEWLVVESDESDGTFLHLQPDVAVITNIEPEHLDHYGTFGAQLTAFEDFANSVKADGMLFLCADHPETRALAMRMDGVPLMTYGLDTGSDYTAVNTAPFGTGHSFTLQHADFDYEAATPLPGNHYVQNAAAALAVAHYVEADMATACAKLKDFGGIKRRFEVTGDFYGATVVDDYAHHPTEIEATLKAAQEITGGRIVAVMEPHRYTRLQGLMDGFAKSVAVADYVFVLPVYTAGETPIEGVDHYVLAEQMRQENVEAQTVETLAELKEALKPLSSPADIIICVGAGSISSWAHQLGGADENEAVA